MLKNYLKVALRTLRRRPGYTAINVGGLALGLAACLLVYAFIQHETSFDAHHPAAERTYRVNTHFEDFIGGTPSRQAQAPTRLIPRLRRGVPGVEHAAPVQRASGRRSVEAGGQSFEQEGIAYVSPSFFEMFDYPMLIGSAERLGAPGTAVLAERTAERYFGGVADAMGRSVRLGGERTLEIVGVAEDPPATTHLPFQVMASYATLASASDDWFDDQSFTDGHSAFVVLAEGAEPKAVEARLNAVRASFQDTEAQQNTAFRLQPVTAIHTTPAVSDWNGQYQTAPAQLWALALVGAIIALLAVVNFVNLATAQASRRAREVGVRKTVGARREQVAAQFLGEAALLTLGAALLGWFVAYEALPLFGRFFGLEIARATLLGPQALLFGGGATVLTALLAGFYPALVLSGYRPAAVLKGASGSGPALRGARLRKGLTVFQLAVAQALLVGTLVVAWQMSYMQAKDLGFEADARLTVDVPHDSSGRVRFRRALSEKPAVRGVTYAMGGPTKRGASFSSFTTAHAPGDTMRAVRLIPIDAQYLGVYGIELLAGRNLQMSDQRASGTRPALANRAMAARLGHEEHAEAALGTALTDKFGDIQVRVVGVTEHFHHSPLRYDIDPALMFYDTDRADQAGVALDPARAGAGLSQAKAAFAAAFPGTHFRYVFFDDYLHSLYDDERRVARAFAVFTALAVVIACLGLFGLAAFAAERRRKEIAVRKTFGATTRQLVALLSKDFLKLVAVGFAIATPLAWYAMQRWLEGFAYRIELGPLVFLAAGALVLVVALAATGTQALRAARANPADALRDE